MKKEDESHKGCEKKTLKKLIKELRDVLEDTGYTNNFLSFLSEGLKKKKVQNTHPLSLNPFPPIEGKGVRTKENSP